MLLLDTSVISELIKAASDAAVLSWIDSVPTAEFSVASITQAELLAGVAFLPPGRRRDNIALAIDAIFADVFRQRVLPFDSAAELAVRSALSTPPSQLSLARVGQDWRRGTSEISRAAEWTSSIRGRRDRTSRADPALLPRLRSCQLPRRRPMSGRLSPFEPPP